MKDSDQHTHTHTHTLSPLINGDQESRLLYLLIREGPVLTREEKLLSIFFGVFVPNRSSFPNSEQSRDDARDPPKTKVTEKYLQSLLLGVNPNGIRCSE
jgi:hypothetical protein